jgi:hypothetical protein
MNQLLIFGPVFAMMVLVSIVAVLTFRERVRQYKAMRMHPQKAPTRKEFSAAMQDTRCSDNFQNLFEMPVMFYVACLGMYFTQTVGTAVLVLAWVYVLLRYAHSWVHCGPNKVMLRFRFFAMSFFALVAIWAMWGYALLGK